VSPVHDPVGEAIRDPLPGLREQLAGEYEGIIAVETIDRVAEQVLDEFENAQDPSELHTG
jgi:hypothetical protein